jgi:hypothetical protein
MLGTGDGGGIREPCLRPGNVWKGELQQQRPLEAMDLVLRARSQGNNPCQTQVMALGVPLLDHFPLDPVSSLRYKTVLSLTLLSIAWRRHGIAV